MTILAPLNAPNTDGIDPGMVLIFPFIFYLPSFHCTEAETVELHGFSYVFCFFVQIRAQMCVLRTVTLRVGMILWQ